jgi:type III restriction enzyme
MQAKDFQQKALDRLELYLAKLQEAYAATEAVEKLRRENPGLDIPLPDFTDQAWRKMREMGEVGREQDYSPRKDGMGNPVPNVTLKVPTGGGKTYLAVHALSKVLDLYFADDSEKFVLWIVPSEAIYTQTKHRLQDREDPLRKLLDIASGNRTKILEKDSPINRHDLKGQLTIMLLMLPSANRQDAVNKLNLFKDKGTINGFLPPDDDPLAHAELREKVPNLDIVRQGDLLDEDGERPGNVRSSPGNALRLLRPMIVLDEGHKGFSRLAHQTLYGFNPRFVLELTATPKDEEAPRNAQPTDPPPRKSNWLVDISGRELEQEEMIKMPIIVNVTPGNSWKDCLREAWQEVASLQAEAEKLESNEQRYIRPILLVQVENTGDRIEGRIHSDDAKAYLIELGVPEDAIAIKTSDLDELKTLEERNLLDRACPVRAIITMRALQEGWDCPFAYVLCSLAATYNVNAMTQLVGRILRQPHVTKTGVEALDQCYVYTFRSATKDVVERIKEGLEKEGMGDMAGKIVDKAAAIASIQMRERRAPYRERKYYLPQVLVYETEQNARELDWETDILGAIDWSALHLHPPIEGLSIGTAVQYGGVSAVDLSVLEGETSKLLQGPVSAAEFDYVFAVRSLLAHVPNPWVAEEWADEYISALRKGDWDDKMLAEHQQFVVREMVAEAGRVVETAAKQAFEAGIAEGKIVFHLVAEKWWPNWQLPETAPIAVTSGSKRVRREDDSDLERDLFPPTYQSELNGLELKVACFLDRQEALSWWYRNLVRGQGYGLQGWRKNRIYPDFIIAQEQDGEVQNWLVIETKGNQLAGNLDTVYKAEVMEKLTTAYEKPPAKVGQLTLFERKAEYKCALVAEGSWEAEIRGMIPHKP